MAVRVPPGVFPGQVGSFIFWFLFLHHIPDLFLSSYSWFPIIHAHCYQHCVTHNLEGGVLKWKDKGLKKWNKFRRIIKCWSFDCRRYKCKLPRVGWMLQCPLVRCNIEHTCCRGGISYMDWIHFQVHTLMFFWTSTRCKFWPSVSIPTPSRACSGGK